MAYSDKKDAASSTVSPTVAVQGRAVITHRDDYKLKTTTLRVCTAIAIRCHGVAILIHADESVTESVIGNAVSKARQDAEGDLIVQYICKTGHECVWEKRIQNGITGNADVQCVETYPDSEGVIVVMESGKEKIYVISGDKSNFNSTPLYERLEEIVNWNLLYILLKFDKLRKFGKLFIETEEDVNLAKVDAIKAFRELKHELVTDDDSVSIECLKWYIDKNIKQDANLGEFLQVMTGITDIKELKKKCGKAVRGRLRECLQSKKNVVPREEVSELFREYTMYSEIYATDINDANSKHKKHLDSRQMRLKRD